MEEQEFSGKLEELKVFLTKLDLIEMLSVAEIVKKRLDEEAEMCESLWRK